MKHRLRLLAVGLALIGLGSTAPVAWAAWDLAALMQQLAQHPSGRAQFTETKTLALLDAPVLSSGELVYRPPDRLEKHTLKPKPESLVIQGNDLFIDRQGAPRQQLRLSQYPEVTAFVDALRGTLVGNQALLQQHYALALSGSEKAWQLMLTPQQASTRRWVKQITVFGAHNVVKRVHTLQADGDESVIEITPVASTAP